jgi:DNA-binding NarL/FixJ family response regulator
VGVKVFVADDHQIFREGIVRLIEKQKEYNVVADEGNGRVAYEKIRKLQPDIAVLDINMPEMNGYEIAKKLNSADSKIKVIMLTMNTEEEYFTEAIKAGVKGYLLKENSSEDLLDALEVISRGGTFISPLLSGFLLKHKDKMKSFTSKNPDIEALTPKERQVLSLVADGKTSKEIADELFISYRTVGAHRLHICAKLNMNGSNKLLQFALANKAVL